MRKRPDFGSWGLTSLTRWEKTGDPTRPLDHFGEVDRGLRARLGHFYVADGEKFHFSTGKPRVVRERASKRPMKRSPEREWRNSREDL